MSDNSEKCMTDLESIVASDDENANSFNFVPDTFSSVTFSLVVGSALEIFVYGLSPVQLLKSRAMATPINIVLGGPYGRFRDYVFNKVGVSQESNCLKKAGAAIACFAGFWVPVYSGILYAAGADSKQIATAAVTTALMSVVLAKPYDLYMEKVRVVYSLKDAWPLDG